MYTVIFKAEIKRVDAEYDMTAVRIRELAINEFGCKQYTSVSEGDTEIFISHWESREQIKSFQQHPVYVAAHDRARKRWYKRYDVQILELLEEFSSDLSDD